MLSQLIKALIKLAASILEGHIIQQFCLPSISKNNNNISGIWLSSVDKSSQQKNISLS